MLCFIKEFCEQVFVEFKPLRLSVTCSRFAPVSNGWWSSLLPLPTSHTHLSGTSWKRVCVCVCVGAYVCASVQHFTQTLSVPLPKLGLLDLFVPSVVSDNTARNKAALPSQPPAPLISFYNDVLEHLVTIATSEEMTVLDWPIPEFAANKPHKSE